MVIDPFETKKRYRKRPALFGRLCVQQVKPYGSVEDVRNTVKKLITELGQGEGISWRRHVT